MFLQHQIQRKWRQHFTRKTFVAVFKIVAKFLEKLQNLSQHFEDGDKPAGFHDSKIIY